MSARTLIATTTLWLLKQIFIFVALLSLLGSELAKAQTVLLDDDFQADVPFGGSNPDGLPQPDFIKWSVIEGTVDLLSDDPTFGFNSLCAAALGIPVTSDMQCVDLDGTTNNAGTMETKETFNLLPGTVQLMFDLAGSQRNLFVEPNTVTVSLSTVGGSVFSKDFFKAFDDPFETITENIALTEATAATLIFDHAGGDNVGLLLDNVKLIQLTDSSAKGLIERAITELSATQEAIEAALSGVGDSEEAIANLDKAIARLNSSLLAFQADDPCRLLGEDCKVGKEFFRALQRAVEAIFEAIDEGGIYNSGILKDLEDTVVGKILEAANIVAATAIDDATDAAGDPTDIAQAEFHFTMAELQTADGVSVGILARMFFEEAVESFDEAWRSAREATGPCE